MTAELMNVASEDTETADALNALMSALSALLTHAGSSAEAHEVWRDAIVSLVSVGTELGCSLHDDPITGDFKFFSEDLRARLGLGEY